jgi:DNA repair protein RadA/Sms
MLLAVLEKRCGFKISLQDVFVNIAGGIKVSDTAADLGIAVSIVSSFQNIPVPNKVVCAGEIGLSGEIRGVNRIDQRLKEAEKLGFKDFIMSSQVDVDDKEYSINIHRIENISEVFRIIFT